MVIKSNKAAYNNGIQCHGIMYKKQIGRDSEALRDANHILGGYASLVLVLVHQGRGSSNVRRFLATLRGVRAPVRGFGVFQTF